MPSLASQRKLAWQRHRDEWQLTHPCRECGSTERLRIVWNGPKDARPLKAMTEAFRLSAARREPILAQCHSLCEKCWLLTLKRNVHGGGKTGIAACFCDLCKEVRRLYYNERGRENTARWQERRKKLIELGAVPPKRKAKGNGWNVSERGKEHKRLKRTQIKDEWMRGRTCAVCGTDEKLVTVWNTYPGPLHSTTRLWTMSQRKRDELLPNCHTECISCSRYACEERKKEKRK